MSGPLPLECLRFFEGAGCHQSFVKAAREIGCTRSAVSYRVKVLERHLQVALFDRHGSDIGLTAHGRVYLHDVQRILRDIQVATDRQRMGPASRRRPGNIAVKAVAEE